MSGKQDSVARCPPHRAAFLVEQVLNLCAEGADVGVAAAEQVAGDSKGTDKSWCPRCGKALAGRSTPLNVDGFQPTSIRATLAEPYGRGASAR